MIFVFLKIALDADIHPSIQFLKCV